MKYNEFKQPSDSQFIKLKLKVKKTCVKSTSNEKAEVLIKTDNCKIHIPVVHADVIVAAIIKETTEDV